MTRDLKDTVFLPRTDFPMRGGLPKKEPELLAHWAAIDLYGKLRQDGAERAPFVLHDGPPYANGNIHIGHAVNKILKDVVIRSQQMQGRNAVYVPGWDCHGLPIEWKIEEKYRKAGKDKDEVPVLQFRAECRNFAAEWVGIQAGEFRRLGVEGDWQNPYLTMAFDAESAIVREIHKFLLNGGLYKGAKPVMWSVVEKTALAEAEVEYQDVTSPMIWVRFPVVTAPTPVLNGAAVVIWTTTPWTMPGNRAVAYGEEIPYAVYTVTEAQEGSLAKVGEKLILAQALAEGVAASAKATFEKGADVTAADLNGAILAHPFRGHPEAGGGYDYAVPLLPGDHVTSDAGTGFVHTAPGHGAEDFDLGRKFGLEVPQTVDADGSYYAHVPLFAGARVYTPEGKPGDANGKSISALIAQGALLAKGNLKHSYPHSWRSKAPLIFRTTPQWFISMDTNDLRARALAAIDETQWVPPQGRNRIHAMVESRPDWCISRQRAWGVPIALFLSKTDGQPLKDEGVLNRIASFFETEGADAWYNRPAADFLGPDYDPADYDQVFDIVDVWFESGSTHAFVLERRNDLSSPADLYLEGSDQHRGWFHSSLLESCGTRGRAPFKAVLTHGFALDEQGRKMSKSLGNVVAPQQVMEEYGADILRLWVVGSDYSEDLKVGKEILKSNADLYRRLRNTLRYLLGALADFTEAERVEPAAMPDLERWVLHRLAEMDAVVRQSTKEYDLHRLITELHNFCAVDLSAFYFDVRKDSLYCDAPTSARRRAVRTVLERLFVTLTAWLAPILCFTAEEAWLAFLAEGDDARRAAWPESVHLRQFPDIPADWRDDALAARWTVVRDVRRAVTGALELKRADKTIGSSLQAHPTVYVQEAHRAALAGLDLAEISITSGITVTVGVIPEGAFTLADVAGVGVVFGPAEGEKCERCWRILPEVPAAAEGVEQLCHRCADAIGPAGGHHA
ncbi:isoleucyl-tRNA synthetase [Nitrospirillum viridazoti Y2]|uniref:Isoleucine--tRNA ligase n=1 Tax=Nitrospirillum amazonense TaxID=28077 RepID=A0A560HZW0_9PROT|nr:isoleucine--tRNA ligase [Nitrospirillum amazonense]EGY01261.1 isoleucyl-tRNA synthetase [Nitrospirillum amazonense Y2]TWB52193.1 isoleucyl-tRNA synthetase [Nitrospirillum amazonense]